MQDLAEIIEQEVDMCTQLLEVEPDRAKCKWPLLTLARLREISKKYDPNQIFQKLQPGYHKL